MTSFAAAYAISADDQHQIKPIPDQKVIAGEDLEFYVEAEGGIAYQMEPIQGLNFPEGAHLINGTRDPVAIFSKKARFYWRPETAQAGTSPYGAAYWISLTATTSYFSLSDWQGLTDRPTKPVKVKITVLPRKPPTFDPVPDQIIQSWQVAKFIISAKKNDGSKAVVLDTVYPHSDPQILKPANNPYTFDFKTGTFQWYASLENAGKTYGLQFRSIDGGPSDNPAKLDVKIIVRPAKKVVIKNIADQTVEAGKVLALEVVGFNEDQSRAALYDLKFTGSPLPSLSLLCISTKGTANFQQHSPGTFTWTACPEHIGQTFTAQASACAAPAACTPDLKGTLNFKVKVVAAVPQPQIVHPDPKPVKKPVIKNIGDRTLKAGETLTFYVVGFNEDQTQVAHYDAKFVGPDFPPASPLRLGSPAFVQHDAGTFTWISCAADIGKTYNARAFASSAGGLPADITATLDFKITVVAPPPVKQPSPKPPLQIVNPDKPKPEEPKQQPPVTENPQPEPPLISEPSLPSPDSRDGSLQSVPEPGPSTDPAPVTSPEPEPPAAAPDSCTVKGKTRNTAEVAKSMEGVWDSRTWGTVYAKAIGSRLEGTYTAFFGRFEASINADCDIEGRWREFQLMSGGDKTGTFKMKTIKNSAGEYMQEQYDDAVPGQVMTAGWGWRKFDSTLTPEPDWYLKSINPGRSLAKGHQHVVCPSGDTCSSEEMNRIAQAFAGRWETNEGDIETSASGTFIQGTLAGSGKISGTVQPDGSIKGRWKLSPDSHGEFIFWIDPIAKGLWGHKNSDSDPGVWDEGWQGEKIN